MNDKKLDKKTSLIVDGLKAKYPLLWEITSDFANKMLLSKRQEAELFITSCTIKYNEPTNHN